MTLPASGRISISEIAAEFGGTAPHSLTEYYGAASGVPVSGIISLSDFYGKAITPPAGQRIWASDGNGVLADTPWVVPDGVTSICAVVIAGAGGEVVIMRGTTYLLGSNMAIQTGIGGGNGGRTGTPCGRNYYNTDPGGGGAGGYTSNGGDGGSSVGSPVPGYYGSSNGSGSYDGGGGGGSGHGTPNVSGYGGNGGGVGLLGSLGGGYGGSGGVSGSEFGSDGGMAGYRGTPDLPFGRGTPKSYAGGNLRWRNDIPVTPGETLIIRSTPGMWYNNNNLPQYIGSPGGVRVMWGKGRTYPYNANADAEPGGYKVWRVRILSGQVPGNNLALATLELRNTVGGAKVSYAAANVTTNSARAGTSYAVSRLADTSAVTEWQSALGVNTGVYIQFALSHFQAVREVVLRTSSLAGLAPTAFVLEASDTTSNFTVVRTFTNLDLAVSTEYKFAI